MLARCHGFVLAVALIVCGCFAAAGPQNAIASEATRTETETVLRVGAYENPPLIIIDGEDVSGLAPEVLEEIARRNRWRIEYVIGSWSDQLGALERGDVDLLMVVAWTEERSQSFHFSETALLTNWGVVATSASSDTSIRGLADLEGLTIAVLKDDVYLDSPYGLPDLVDAAGIEAEIVPHDSYAEAVDSVISGEADAVLGNRLVILESTGPAKLQATPIVVHPVSVRYAAPLTAPTSESLLATLDITLAELKLDPDSPYYTALGDHLPWVLPSNEGLPEWAVLAAIASVVILVVMVAAVLLLRSAVGQQTRELGIVVERFRALFDAIPDAVFVLSPHGVILDVKEARDWHLNIPVRDQIGTHVLQLAFPKSTRQDIAEGLERVANDGISRTITYFLNTPFPEGELRHFEARICQAGSNELLMIVRDTTEQVLAEQLERARSEELETAVAARTEELVETNLELVAASQAKSVFLANMSHELRTPLNSIIGFSGTMLSGLAGELNEEQRRQLEMVSTSGKHLLSLVDDVLDLSRVESGRTDPVPEALNVMAAVEEAVAVVENRALQKGISLETDIDDVDTVFTDRRMVLQVLLNLLNNAIKFTSEGGVIVRVRRHDPRAVLIQIEDSGPGIPAHELPNVFESFYQVPRADVAKSEGFGLGLPISARLARMLGGELSVDSEVGRGSTFSFIISDYADTRENT